MTHDDLCPWPTQACACPLIRQVRADERINRALADLLNTH